MTPLSTCQPANPEGLEFVPVAEEGEVSSIMPRSIVNAFTAIREEYDTEQYNGENREDWQNWIKAHKKAPIALIEHNVTVQDIYDYLGRFSDPSLRSVLQEVLKVTFNENEDDLFIFALLEDILSMNPTNNELELYLFRDDVLDVGRYPYGGRHLIKISTYAGTYNGTTYAPDLGQEPLNEYGAWHLDILARTIDRFGLYLHYYAVSQSYASISDVPTHVQHILKFARPGRDFFPVINFDGHTENPLSAIVGIVPEQIEYLDKIYL